MKLLTKISAVAIAIAPYAVFAQPAEDGGVGGNIEALIETAQSIVNSLVPLMMTLALVYFIWGLIVYIKSAGDPAEAKKGRGIMIWGVVALFVMVSVWGLTTALGDIFGISADTAPITPEELNPSEGF